MNIVTGGNIDIYTTTSAIVRAEAHSNRVCNKADCLPLFTLIVASRCSVRAATAGTLTRTIGCAAFAA